MVERPRKGQIVKHRHYPLERYDPRRHDLAGQHLHPAVPFARNDSSQAERNIAVGDADARVQDQRVGRARDASRFFVAAEGRAVGAELDLGEHAARAEPPSRHSSRPQQRHQRVGEYVSNLSPKDEVMSLLAALGFQLPRIPMTTSGTSLYLAGWIESRGTDDESGAGGPTGT